MMDNKLEIFKKKLIYRAGYRGTKEMDILLSSFVNKNIGFGHKRLSIIDLSDNGSQPMKSKDSRFILNYNGELYNFKQLQRPVNLIIN